MTNTITLEGVEYNLVPVEAETVIPRSEDEYAKIRKHVGRWGTVLGIKGDKMLKSYSDRDIAYTDRFAGYIHELHFEETTMSELERGDVFVCVDSDWSELNEYLVFLGVDTDLEYVSQYICNYSGVESIRNRYIYQNEKVIKILRN